MQPLQYQAVTAAQDIPIKLLPRFPRVSRHGGSSFAWVTMLGALVLGQRDSLRGSALSGMAWPVLPSTPSVSEVALGTAVVWSIPRTAYGWHFRYSRAVLQLCGDSPGHWDERELVSLAAH